MLHPTGGDPELIEEHGDPDGLEGELDARVLAPPYSSADRRFCKCDSFACNYEDHFSRVEVCVMSLRSRWLPCTTSLRWHRDGKGLAFSSCMPAVARADPNLVHRWYVRPLEFWRRGSYGGACETDSERR